MRQSPRIRRLHSDFKAMEKLRSESSILDFDFTGNPADQYRITFRGNGCWRPDGSAEILIRELHVVNIDFGAAYPRMMPELSWQTPIFHPNISASGIVCLGGYGTHWVPSVMLDELCNMLWDMIRYKNYDVESPYNREAAVWAKSTSHEFPVDSRPLRDRISSDGTPLTEIVPPIIGATNQEVNGVTFLESEIVEAEIIEPEDPQDIMFID